MLNWQGWADGSFLGWVSGEEPPPAPVPVTFGGGYLREPKEPIIIPIDDDDILLAWFMFMRQP